ncbi:hypothetical protein H3V53_03390 [Paraburkholderia bengalensis]|uniref:Peptidase C39-like domain-containing protein n=1 Tax=Paraburkholderia bengalensis TaxID=2747562 RepID=A0ABU8IL11_9BURK
MKSGLGVMHKRRRFLGLGTILTSISAFAPVPVMAKSFFDDAGDLPADWGLEIVSARQPPDADFCWLAAATMVLSWLGVRPTTLESTANWLGGEYRRLYHDGVGLPVDMIPEMAARLAMATAPLASLSLEWWEEKIVCGPMILIGMTDISPGPHARVLIGMSREAGSGELRVKYIDPLDGSTSSRSMRVVQRFYETLPIGHISQLPPTQVLYFDQPAFESRIQFRVREGVRERDQQ